MNAMADQPLVQAGDLLMTHKDYAAATQMSGMEPCTCPGALRFGERYAKGRMIEVQCDEVGCHAGFAMFVAEVEATRDRMSRRLDRLTDGGGDDL